MDFSIQVRERAKKAIEASDYKSYRKLSLDSGWSESRVHGLVSGKFDDSKDGPGFFGICRMCEKLGITPNTLAGLKEVSGLSPSALMNASTLTDPSKPISAMPTPEKIAHRYLRSGGRIEAFGDYLDYMDIYDPPESDGQAFTIRKVGRMSLAALVMGEACEKSLRIATDEMPQSTQDLIHTSRERAWDAGYLSEVRELNERLVGKPLHVKIDYLRVSIRLTDAEGNDCLAIFCKLIPQ